MTFFAKLGKPLKICRETQMTVNSENNLEQKNQSKGITLPNLKIHYKGT